MNILIFKTSVQHHEDVQKMALIFDHHSGIKKWSIDWDDWEKILRIETDQLTAENVIDLLRAANIFALELK